MNIQPEIAEKLKLIEEEYIELEKLRIYCGTFNVNGKSCDESLTPWLCLNQETKKKAENDDAINSSLPQLPPHVDIYAIGFQELVDLTTTNLLISSNSIEKEIAWINAINNELLNEDNFKVFCYLKIFFRN